MNIKKDFHIDSLYDIFTFIDLIDNGLGGDDGESQIIEYANLIKSTTLTAEMFTGDKGIFKGFKKETRKGYGLKFDGQGYSVRFYHGSPFVQVSIMYSKDEYEKIGEAMFLTDLAAVTAKKPMELC